MDDENNINQNNFFEENDDNINVNNLKILDDEITNLTDSDIEDEKYQPGYPQSLYSSNSTNNINIQNNLNIEIQNKRIKEANNKIFELTKINKDFDLQLKYYKTEFLKLQEAYKIKENICKEFQMLINSANGKFKKLEEKNLFYKKENEKQKEIIEKLENELNEKNNVNKYDINYKNIDSYQKQIKDIEYEYSEKERKLNQKYIDKENKIKNDLFNEVSKLNRQIDELKNENEKIKYDYSNQKITIDSLQGKIDDKDFEHISQLNKSEKEINKLTDKNNEYQNNIKELENKINELKNSYSNEILKLKNENEELFTESNMYKNNIKELETQIINLNNIIELNKKEILQNKFELNNKNREIEELQKDNNELINKTEMLNNEIELYEQAKQNDILRYSLKIDELIREKAQLESDKKELIDKLTLATNSIKQYKEYSNKQKNIYEQKLFKANAKYEGLEKKYKNLTKQKKNKEKILVQQNQNLQHKIIEIETERSQIEMEKKIQNLSNYNTTNNFALNNNLNSSMMINNNNNLLNLPPVQNNLLNGSFTFGKTNSNNLAMINLNNINQTSNIGTFSINYDDPNEENQKKTLEDFKKLLAKIDEKLD